MTFQPGPNSTVHFSISSNEPAEIVQSKIAKFAEFENASSSVQSALAEHLANLRDSDRNQLLRASLLSLNATQIMDNGQSWSEVASSVGQESPQAASDRRFARAFDELLHLDDIQGNIMKLESLLASDVAKMLKDMAADLAKLDQRHSQEMVSCLF